MHVREFLLVVFGGHHESLTELAPDEGQMSGSSTLSWLQMPDFVNPGPIISI